MYTMNRPVALALLQVLWTSCIHGYAVAPAHPTITAAPERNLLLQERQGSSVTCSEWSISGVGNIQCPAASTCLVQDTTLGYGGCFYASANVFTFKTTCYDYPTSYAVNTASDLYCGATAPYCGYLAFEAPPSATWIDYICRSTRQINTAYYVGSGAFFSTTATTTDSISNSSPTPTPTSTDPGSSPSPQPASGGGSSSGSSSNAAVIGGAVGGAVGGIALILIAILAFICVRRGQRRRAMEPQGPGISTGPPPLSYKSPTAFEPPAEYKAPVTDMKPTTTTYVSQHC